MNDSITVSMDTRAVLSTTQDIGDFTWSRIIAMTSTVKMFTLINDSLIMLKIVARWSWVSFSKSASSKIINSFSLSKKDYQLWMVWINYWMYSSNFWWLRASHAGFWQCCFVLMWYSTMNNIMWSLWHYNYCYVIRLLSL